VEISADTTAESKLLTCRRVIDVKWTFLSEELGRFWSSWTFRKFYLRNVGQTLKIIVASVAEVSCSETEENRDRATVATLVFKKIHPMFGTHLKQKGKVKSKNWNFNNKPELLQCRCNRRKLALQG
jgi:hypothetical protein